MKHVSRKILALLAAVTMLGCSGAALAAEEAAPAAPTVAVQLDGKPLSFTDAVPQVRDQRTFLPFRAVFEAMGAEVGNEGTTITAKRGEKTLTMVIGSAEAVVEENGVKTPVVMDVAPYVDNTTWRTYVPVRFAAQAFDCAVGWDQANQTAIIVDTEKLLDEVKAGKSFTYMEKYLAYAETYSTGLWDTDLSFSGLLDLTGLPMEFAGKADGTIDGSEKLDLDMTMTMDLTGYMQALYAQAEAAGQPMEPMTAEEQAQLEQLAKEGIGLAMRGDLSKGVMYMNLNGALLEASGMDGNTWYSMDLASLLAQSGMTLEQMKSTDYEAMLKTAVKSVTLTDSTTGYVQMKLLAEKAAGLFSDASFTRKGTAAVNSFTYSAQGVNVEITLQLTMKNNAVVGYDMAVRLGMSDAETSMDFDVRAAMDAKNRMTAEVTMDLGGLMGLRMSMEGGYTKATAAPVTEPPAGAVIFPYEQLIQGAGQAA